MRLVLLTFFFLTNLFAHTPLLTCIDEGDGSVTCEGGFSDGSSAGGIKFRLEQNGKVLLDTKLNGSSEVNFQKPQGAYSAVFDAGAGHIVYVNSKNIFE